MRNMTSGAVECHSRGNNTGRLRILTLVLYEELEMQNAYLPSSMRKLYWTARASISRRRASVVVTPVGLLPYCARHGSLDSSFCTSIRGSYRDMVQESGVRFRGRPFLK